MVELFGNKSIFSGLFHGAIGQSGAATTVHITYDHSPIYYTRYDFIEFNIEFNILFYKIIYINNKKILKFKKKVI